MEAGGGVRVEWDHHVHERELRRSLVLCGRCFVGTNNKYLKSCIVVDDTHTYFQLSADREFVTDPTREKGVEARMHAHRRHLK